MVVVNQARTTNDVGDHGSEEPATTQDVTEGGVIGAVGGAVVGALAGGPAGAFIGAMLGAAASAGAVEVVDRHDNDYSAIPGADEMVKDIHDKGLVNSTTAADYKDVDGNPVRQSPNSDEITGRTF